MGKVVATTTKKKKGRPSLIDLQKRQIKQQHIQIHSQSQKSNTNSALTTRRSTRRNPQLDHSSYQLDQLGRNSHRTRNSDTDDDGDVDAKNVVMKKQKMITNAIVDGSCSGISSAPKLVCEGANSNAHQGTVENGGNGTPLPDNKLLVFILDRLEKKDTHGVFSEPVDPEELPDYHEVIKHPMDFSTVRQKLDGGEYANLEAFESDIFLICSNAMQYNAPDTVYFRQARSIQELAEKSFDNLRQDSDAEEEEPEPKRRGRPPTKHLKKPLGRPPIDRTGSENVSGATLATVYDLRKCSPMEKAGYRDSAGRSRHKIGNSEAYNSGWSSYQKLDRDDDFTGSHLRGSYKQGKKPIISPENRRDTYTQFHPSASINNYCFSTFDVEKKMLLPVGLHAEYCYARSLSRFAAGLGHVAWDIASKKIEKSLPPDAAFGPGWVDHKGATTQRPLPINSISSSQAGGTDSLSPPLVSAHSALRKHGDESAFQHEENYSLGYQLASTIAALGCQPAAAAAISIAFSSSRPSENIAQLSEISRAIPEGQTQIPQSSISASRQRPSFQYQLQMPRPTINSPAYPLPHLNASPLINQLGSQQLGMPLGFSQNYSLMANMVPSQNFDSGHHMAGRSKDGTNLFSVNGSPSDLNASCITPDLTSRLHQDLNLQFNSPATPNSSRMDSKHPDLALQL